MARVIGLKNKETIPVELGDYEISDLLNQIDCILSEYGFVTGFEGEIAEGHNYRLYEGLEGIAMVRFVNNKGDFIPYIQEGVVKAECPVFIELKGLPEKVSDSLGLELSSII